MNLYCVELRAYVLADDRDDAVDIVDGELRGIITAGLIPVRVAKVDTVDDEWKDWIPYYREGIGVFQDKMLTCGEVLEQTGKA